MKFNNKIQFSIFFFTSAIAALYFSILDPVYTAPAWGLLLYVFIIIINPNNTYVPILYVSVFTIFYLSWIKDIDPNLLRTNADAWVDSQKYSASAVKYIETGYGYGHWLGKGIEYYLTTIYRLFGINELNVITVNVALILIGMVFLIQDNDLYYSPGLVLLFCPLLLFYAAQPSKEVITFPFVAMLTYLYIKLIKNFRIRTLILILIVFIAFAYVRLSAAMLVIVCLSFSYFAAKPSLRNILLLLTIVLTSLFLVKSLSSKLLGSNFDFWTYVINFSDANSRLSSYIEKKDVNTNSSATKIKLMLSPENKVLSAILTPIKALFVLVSPVPSVPSLFMPLDATQSQVSLYTYRLLAFQSGFLNLIALSLAILRRRTIFLAIKTKPALRLIFAFLVCYLFLVAYAYPTAFTRHRVVVEPIFWLFVLQFLPLNIYLKITVGWCYLVIFILSFLGGL